MTEGRVEVLYNGTWGTICDDSWSTVDADVVCRQLGYNFALEAVSNALFGAGEGPIWLDDMQCLGEESSIAACSHSAWGTNNCRHLEDVGVHCFSEWVWQGGREWARLGGGGQWCGHGVHIITPPTASHPLLRLVGGNSQTEGRVEIFYDGRWGTICDDSWNIDDANVVCRMLGFQRAISAPGFSSFGSGTGQVGMPWVGGDLHHVIFLCLRSGWTRWDARVRSRAYSPACTATGAATTAVTQRMPLSSAPVSAPQRQPCCPIAASHTTLHPSSHRRHPTEPIPPAA